MAEKILIIDAEKPTVDMISMLLKKRGYEVYDALCAQTGLRMAYQHQPDLVLLEVVLSSTAGPLRYADHFHQRQNRQRRCGQGL